MTSPSPLRPAFRALERAWLRRAVARVEPMVWIEIAAIALLASGFLFWQVRVGLASLVHDHGATAGFGRLAAMLGLLVLGGALQTGTGHLVRLREGASAPPWLALPVPDEALGAHLAALSRWKARWQIIPALALLVAGARILPVAGLAALALAFFAAFEAASAAAAAIALRIAAARAPARAGLDPLARTLVHATHGPAARRLPAASWSRASGALALWRNDARLAWRSPASRRRALTAIAAIALSLVAWRLALEPRLAHFVAFGLALVAAGTVAEWLITAIGADPADVLRALPLGLGSAWGARMGWAALATVALVAGHAISARGVEPPALAVFLVWLALAALAVMTLGVNYGVSLYPRSDQAQRLLALSLGLAIAASLMVPLMGWIVLLTAVIHSLRRVARWSRAEVR